MEAEGSPHQDRMRRLVTALRSGEWAQGCGMLQTIGVGFCCLGVACEVAIADGLGLARNEQGTGAVRAMFYGDAVGGSATVLPDEAREWYGFVDDNPWLKVPDEILGDLDDSRFTTYLDDSRFTTYHDASHTYAAAELNDDYGLTLPQIGDCFEYTFLPGDWEVTRAAR